MYCTKSFCLLKGYWFYYVEGKPTFYTLFMYVGILFIPCVLFLLCFFINLCLLFDSLLLFSSLLLLMWNVVNLVVVHTKIDWLSSLPITSKLCVSKMQFTPTHRFPDSRSYFVFIFVVHTCLLTYWSQKKGQEVAKTNSLFKKRRTKD